MKLFDATLDLAGMAQGTQMYNISSVDIVNNRFTCDDMSARTGRFTNGGTVWFLTGENAGRFDTVKSASDQYARLTHTQPNDYAVGDSVALSSWRYFDTNDLVQAVNHVLSLYPIMDVWEQEIEPEEESETMSYTHKDVSFLLPESVTADIRRVEIENAYRPGEYVTCHYWQQYGRNLIIDRKHIYKEGGKFRIHFVRKHGTVTQDDEINERVDRDYILYMANLYLWRNEIQNTHKDNPIAVDMYNEAKLYEDAQRKKNIPQSNLLPRDMTYTW